MDETNEDTNEKCAFENYEKGIDAERHGKMKEAKDFYTLAMIIDHSKNQQYIDAVKRIVTIINERHPPKIAQHCHAECLTPKFDGGHSFR